MIVQAAHVVTSVTHLSLIPQAPTGEAFSPARPAPPSHNSDTPSTLSTSPGESRGWNTARTPSHGLGGDNAGCKRARSGSTLPPPPPPLPPPRSSPPRSDGDRQGQHGAATGGSGPAKVQQGHPRRGSRETDGHGSPSGVQAAVRTGEGCFVVPSVVCKQRS